MMNKVTYDEKSEALYIKISKEKIEDTKSESANVNIDYDSENDIVGIEILNVKQLDKI